MKPTLFVRPLTDEERRAVQAGLRSADAFTLRRCQILAASAAGQRSSQIAAALRCAEQTVRNALNAFAAEGLASLREKSHRPHSVQPVLDAAAAGRLKAILHRSPRDFGEATSLWTLALAAKVAFEQGLSPQLLSDETIRQTLIRLGVGWKRAKRWITSPDPDYARKKGRATV